MLSIYFIIICVLSSLLFCGLCLFITRNCTGCAVCTVSCLNSFCLHNQRTTESHLDRFTTRAHYSAAREEVSLGDTACNNNKSLESRKVARHPSLVDIV